MIEKIENVDDLGGYIKPDILYICDRRACENCSSQCKHTTNISHAKNFEKGPKENSYVEICDKFLPGSKEKMYKNLLNAISQATYGLNKKLLIYDLNGHRILTEQLMQLEILLNNDDEFERLVKLFDSNENKSNIYESLIRLVAKGIDTTNIISETTVDAFIFMNYLD